jgi:hypothetical protein
MFHAVLPALAFARLTTRNRQLRHVHEPIVGIEPGAACHDIRPSSYSASLLHRQLVGHRPRLPLRAAMMHYLVAGLDSLVPCGWTPSDHLAMRTR